MKNRDNLISFFDKISKSYSSSDEQLSLESFKEFVYLGKTSFQHSVILWDEEEIVNYDILDIYGLVKGFYLSKGIKEFSDKKQYQNLLKGFFYIILNNILNLKKEKINSGILGADLSLMYILSLTYFPQEADLIGKQLIRFIKYHKAKEEEKKHYKGRMKEIFGYSDVVWLSSVISKYYGKELLSKEIREYCNSIINPTYKKAVDNLFSKDQLVVNKWVNELVEFHIQNSKSDLTLPFNHEEWQYYPIEIISLLEVRLKEGLKIDFIENDFIKEFLPHLGIDLPVKLDDFTLKLKNRVMGQNS